MGLTASSDQARTQRKEDRVEITYYTDPFCCWSWALEPQWRRLRYEFAGLIKWKYVMGGLIPDWQSYRDPMNSINRPAQMGPLWMEASQVSGMPIQDELWSVDPPASSYPACIAVKTAALQSEAAAEVYLRAVREALMIESKDVARKEILLDIADHTQSRHPDLFSSEHFRSNYGNKASQLAFREDIMKVRFNQIGRFPTLTMTAAEKPGLMITGYRPYHVLLDAVFKIAPGIVAVNDVKITESYIEHWRFLTARELKEIIT
jgi:putative protein-disulfide isomerase